MFWHCLGLESRCEKESVVSKKPTYKELETHLAKAKAHLGAIRDGQVDVTAGSEAALSVQLAETQQSLTRRMEESANYHDHLQFEFR